MPDYTITIKNNSSQSQSFMLFQNLPMPANIPGDHVFTNVYQQAGNVGRNAQATFRISSDFYALHGMSNRSEDGKVKVEISDYRRAKLGPNGSRFYLTTEDRSGQFPMFDREDNLSQSGDAFVISLDGTFDFTKPEKIYFGVGAMVPDRDHIVPVQTYLARPRTVAQIFPKVKYCIAFGNHQPGSIVDIDTLGDILSIDFTTCRDHNATFTLHDGNDYVPDRNVDMSGIFWRVGQRF